jgi:hypothetical protein
MKPRFTVLYWAVTLAAVTSAHGQTVQEAQTPDGTREVVTHEDSPDQRFSVELWRSPENSSTLDDLDSLVILDEHHKPITTRKTFGYIRNVFWSDNGKYVAIYNRRANAGDYVWIFSLPDGKCIKAADDGQLAFLQQLACKAFQRLDSRATDKDLLKVWINPKGWWGNDNKLLIRVACGYDISGPLHTQFVYDATVRVSGSTIAFVSGEARKVAIYASE